MATFNPGDTFSVSLDADDTVTFNGKGIVTVTPISGGTITQSALTGMQTVGSYGKSVTCSFACESSGNYTVNYNALDPVMATTNPVTWRIKKATAGGKNILRAALASRTNAVHRPRGLTTAGSFGSTTNPCLKFEAEAPFSRVRFRLYSPAGAATNFKIAACATETAATDTANNTSQPVVGGVAYPAVQASVGAPGWQIGSVGGVQNFDWPGVGTADLPKELVTDWFDICSVPRADGGTRPLIMFRIEHDSSANGNIGSGNISTWTAAKASGYPWYRIIQAPNISGGGSVTDLTKTTTGESTVAPWVAVEFQYNAPAITVLGIGDSNIEQAGTYSIGSFGTWAWQGVMTASTPDAPFALVNAGRAGGLSSVYSANGFAEIARLTPDVVIYAAGTSNDTPITSAILQQWKNRLARAIFECKSISARLIVYGPLPGVAYTAGYDVFRLAMRDHCIALDAAGVIDYLDFETVLGTGATPNRLQAAMTADGGTHVSNAAEVIMGKMLYDLLIAG